MKSKDDESKRIAKLRWRAEEMTRGKGFPSPENLKPPSPKEALRLIHELRVHQVELKMQNDELLRVQADLDATRARYFDLYNLAPVGYFIVSHEGLILEANLTGVNLLSIARAALVKQPINRFIFKEDQDVYYLHRRKLLATGKANTCELRMVKTDGTTFWARLTATTTQDPSTNSGHGTGGAPVSRVVLTDISEQKLMEQQDKDELDVKLQRAKKSPRVDPKPGRGKGGIGA
jgi:PAS domain S-box-containing protein